ncbi:drosulfakinins [Cimex lectularius]|uniref:Sulfakinin n=1 Tax=Cimex lectularius TaxID=79782 RepID=A0A8I6RSB4_CIMLE|nr:drosulfakinins [Cimex lectularius]
MNHNTMTSILLTLGIYLFLQNTNCLCSAELSIDRPFPRHHIHLRVPQLGDAAFQEDEDALEKRQFNDYGHMRFGKREGTDEKFEDYGYLRFGRSPQ